MNTLESKYRDYKKLKCFWSIRDILWTLKKETLLEDIYKPETEIKTIIIYLTAGIKNRDSIKVKRFISEYYRKYKEYDSIRNFIIFELKYRHKYIKDKTVEYINDDEEEKKYNTLSHEDKVKRQIKTLNNIIDTYMQAGYRIDDILNNDMRNYDYIEDFIINRYEKEINDRLALIYKLGLYIGIAFNNISKYPDKPETIRLRPLTKEEYIKKVQKQTEDFFTTMGSQIKQEDAVNNEQK